MKCSLEDRKLFPERLLISSRLEMSHILNLNNKLKFYLQGTWNPLRSLSWKRIKNTLILYKKQNWNHMSENYDLLISQRQIFQTQSLTKYSGQLQMNVGPPQANSCFTFFFNKSRETMSHRNMLLKTFWTTFFSVAERNC